MRGLSSPVQEQAPNAENRGEYGEDKQEDVTPHGQSLSPSSGHAAPLTPPSRALTCPYTVMRPVVLSSVFAATVSCAGLGCINTDAAVFVEAELTKPQIEVLESSLAVGLEGQATLTLHLGPRASGPSEVSLLGISLLAENAQSVLVESIAVRSEPSFPITLPLDSDRSAVLHIDGPDNSLSTNVKTTLCGASAVMLQVVLDDGLRGATTIATSGPFGLSGCP